ncbi:aminoglycoside 6-adenylyltransferase [Paenibacillus sp. GP183]|uniref:aminoglycoside 6-adenylyltransferase n=1 Tax=Paenibacillus sp. GP183 TaxID=1882751 RepID=UPI00089C79B4|nr:aminoglycoside 6-adenylyltransferase [Paenibacillus sp. GP183]SEB50127.1 aminoglycoside 6-adenylyltransferase [Paenibacillus sp. GP183]
MRSEKEMLDLILRFANDDERVRAVILNGSRVNPEVHRDIFQDYDIEFIVSSVEGFVVERSWIGSNFGELIIMQTPDEHGVPSLDLNNNFAFLMLFTDGNRIDLTLYPVEKISSFEHDSLSLLLLDKDDIVGTLSPPSNKDYLAKPPTAQQFAECCNEFWWVSTYIAKGLWRRELSYVKFMYDRPVRDMLILMLKWHIGLRTNFAVDSGKLGKYYEKFLEPKHWEAFVKSYPDAEYENIWQALFIMCDLFREIALDVANYYQYDYPAMDDKRVSNFLQHIRILPQDAKEIY